MPPPLALLARAVSTPGTSTAWVSERPFRPTASHEIADGFRMSNPLERGQRSGTATPARERSMDSRHDRRPLTLLTASATMWPGFVQVLDAGEIACGSTEFIVMRSRTLTPIYVYLLARTNEFRSNAIKSMVGASGRQRVQDKAVERFRRAHPPQPRLEQFEALVGPMFKLVHQLVHQNANLRSTRDLLLPKLVSGEIDVSGLDIDTEWLAS